MNKDARRILEREREGLDLMSKPVSNDGPMRKIAVGDALWGAGGFALLVIGWQLVVTLSGVPETTLPSPTDVLMEAIANADLLWASCVVTVREILIGFVLAAVIGFVVAVGLSASRTAHRLVYPSLVLMNSVPKVAVAPLFLIWFGFGATTNALLAMTIAVFPVIVNTALGLDGISDDYVRLGKVMGGNPWRLFFRIRLPSALPSIFAGLKLATSFATIGAIVGEFIAGQEGLGYLAQLSAGQLETAITFAAIVVMAMIGLAFFYLVAWLEAVLVGPKQHSR